MTIHVGIWALYITNFLQVLRGASPLLTVAYMAPVAVSGFLASVVTGIALSKLKPAMVMTLALTFFTVGHILIATAPVHQTYWAQTFVCLVVIPWGMDMSFPAATIILSNAVRKEHQGIAASLVTTIVNYSISLGLGFAGTVEVHVDNGGRSPEDVLKGYRGAWYVGIGFAATGLCISIIFLLRGYLKGSAGR
jgi:MFS family permease